MSENSGPKITGEVESQDCADFLEQIVYLLDNELDEVDQAQVRVHLDECGPCLRKYDLERTVKSLVARSCCETAPDGLREKVLLSIRKVEWRISES